MKKLYYSSIAILCLFFTFSCSDDSPTGTDNGEDSSASTMYQLVVSADPVEAGTVTPESDEYEDGETVELTAGSNDDWVFVEWEGDDAGSDNPVSITMDSDKEITALFTKRDYPLTVNIEGEGAVSESVVQDKTTEYEAGTTVELTANAADGWRFVEWQGDLEGDERTETITVDGAKEVTAVFERRDYPLTVNTEGEGGVDEKVVQAKTTDHPYETEVELTANAAAGWTFVEWEGDLEGDENPATITVDDAKEVTAVFERRDYPLTVNTEGEGGVDEKVVQAKTTDHPYETEVELTANAADGWTFVEWEGDLTGSDNPETITVDEEKEVTAVFERRDYPLTVNTEGEGVVEEKEVQAKTTDYSYETNVELTANPATGWIFVEWEGDLEGDENPTTITVDEAKEVTAVFERKDYQLTVKIDGDGVVNDTLTDGTLANYSFESEVELSAQADTGWAFVKWEGDVMGSENPITFTMDGATEITAVFEPFYLHENGVTVLCPLAEVGDSGTVNGTTYTKREANDITSGNAAKTCTSGITSMIRVFQNETGFNEDISSWDVSSVTDMGVMFSGADSFNQDLGSWDVSSVTSLDNMFAGASNFNGDISGWDVSSVTIMNRMFDGATIFNQNLSGWCVSNVTLRADFKTGSALTDENTPVWGTCPD